MERSHGDAVPPRPIADRPAEPARTAAPASPDADAACACPLCGFAAPAESDVYRHLQVSHRKSTIARAVLDGAPDRPATGRNGNDGT